MKEDNSSTKTMLEKQEEEEQNGNAVVIDPWWMKLFNTDKLISASILTTRIGFVLILLLCIMM
jgi:hypothetical protein